MKTSIEEISRFFVDKFTEPHYYLRKDGELYVIKGFKGRNDTPIVDDGSIVGIKSACLNFFPFKRRSKKIAPPEWLFDDYIEWLPGRTFEIDSDLDRRLRQFYSNSFVYWLMEKYPDIEIHDVRGRKLEPHKEGVIVG